MKNGLRWLLLFSLAMNLAVVGTVVFVHFFVGPRPFIVHLAEKKMTIDDNRLNLTDEQAKTFAQARQDFVQRSESRMALLQERRAALINLLAEPDTDAVALKRAIGNVQNVQDQFHQDWVDYVLHVKSVLKPGQPQVFAQVLRERMMRPLDAPLAPHTMQVAQAAPGKPSPIAAMQNRDGKTHGLLPKMTPEQEEHVRSAMREMGRAILKTTPEQEAKIEAIWSKMPETLNEVAEFDRKTDEVLTPEQRAIVEPIRQMIRNRAIDDILEPARVRLPPDQYEKFAGKIKDRVRQQVKPQK